ncbi:hypothetical protein [Candidatus Methylobacter oryzae]|uniref:Uncharacterized protein n=1 Tax=Candidatus Methylobacter oryzae TaxID=2497749 RepID=A0ABY3C7S2_9GAMM|nr:hypothetical protein [Candidatus Methylobacter oryzae]TRW91513.1 hypothetical protein EKO24_016500 [Candidatus Methylobacter oryzae]
MHTQLPNNNQNKRGKRSINKFWTVLSALCLSVLFSTPSYSHRGAADEVDVCRIRVGTEKIHFTAYTPTFTQSQGFCRFIPNVGLTNLIFDYEGKKLRDVSIEFEVTKEPEGTRIFYLEPQKTKSGTVKADVDFSKYGAGDYLAHVTIMHDGEKQDTHLPFVVGAEEEKTPWRRYLFFVISVAVLVTLGIAYLTRKYGDQQNTDI